MASKKKKKTNKAKAAKTPAKKREGGLKKADWTIGQNAPASGRERGRTNARPGASRGHQRQQPPDHGRTAPRELPGNFVNPYNFIRIDHDEQHGDRESAKDTHEQFHKKCFSGRLECELKAMTPLFVPDPEKTIECSDKQPKQMSFCRDHHGNPFIPATSLKGMVRSVLEAVSNSCFSVLTDTRLDYRDVYVSKRLKPAVILELDDNKKIVSIGILDGMAWLPSGYKRGKDFRKGLHKQKSDLKFAYATIQKNRYIVKARVKFHLNSEEKNLLSDLEEKFPGCVRRGRFRAENLSAQKKQDMIDDLAAFRRIFKGKGGKVQEILYHRVTSPLQSSPSGKPNEYQVLIKHTGGTINNKHDERVFFSEKFRMNLKDNLHRIPTRGIDYKRIKDFNYILSEQHNRFAKQKDEAIAEAEMKKRLNRGGPVQVRKGDLVYYLEQGDKLALVLIPRMRYENSPADLIPEFLRPCSDRKRLCPACRIFGMVSGDGKVDSFALQGKISFSRGRLTSGGSLSERPLLKILGSPQPTSTNFYLAEKGNREAVKVTEGGYDRREKTEIRGRKFFWHQGDESHHLGKARYEKNTSLSPKVEIRVEPLFEGATFCFSVYFENFSQDELALLVWSLELETGMCHKLGMGKPLGLGTVKISIVPDKTRSFRVTYEDIRGYYEDIGHSLNKNDLDANGLKQKAIELFGKSMNYQDLSIILRYDEKIAGQVKYPSKGRKGEYFGYEWFSKPKHKNEPLCSIREIKNGHRQTGWEGEQT